MPRNIDGEAFHASAVTPWKRRRSAAIVRTNPEMTALDAEEILTVLDADEIEALPIANIKDEISNLGLSASIPVDLQRAIVKSAPSPVADLLNISTNDPEYETAETIKKLPLAEIKKNLQWLGVSHRAGLAEIIALAESQKPPARRKPRLATVTKNLQRLGVDYWVNLGEALLHANRPPLDGDVNIGVWSGKSLHSFNLKHDEAPEVDRTLREAPPWKRTKRRGVFVGDAALAELRNRLALEPDRLPEPPPPSNGPRHVWLGRLVGIAIVAGVGVLGYRLGSTPPASSPQLASRPGLSGQQTVAMQWSDPATHPTLPWPEPANVIVGDFKASRPAPEFKVDTVQPQQEGEPARLAISATETGPNAIVVIGGLAPGSTLSAGAEVGPNTWRLPVEDLDHAVIAPPRSFVGVMDLTLELRLADNTVADRKAVQLEWLSTPAAAQAQQHNADEIASMIKSGANLMASGDISAARLMYRRAAEAGSALAAFALAETYDPLVVGKLNARGGIASDVALAESWYKKARDFGSAMASERLESLVRLPE